MGSSILNNSTILMLIIGETVYVCGGKEVYIFCSRFLWTKNALKNSSRKQNVEQEKKNLKKAEREGGRNNKQVGNSYQPGRYKSNYIKNHFKCECSKYAN